MRSDAVKTGTQQAPHRSLFNALGMTKEEMIACGDGYNDLTMIQYAGLGVAMENAVLPVKNAADYVTLSNNDDGVAHVIEKFMLS